MLRLSCKQLGRVWGIASTKVTQARRPTFRKIALAMLEYPMETMAQIAEEMEHIQQAACCLRNAAAPGRGTTARPAGPSEFGSVSETPLSEAEWRLRAAMLEGRIDRELIHPRRQQGNKATRQRGE